MGVPADFRAGERAVFPEGYDCYPNFRLQGRLVGTVTEVEPDYVMVKLDMHKPELDEWGNCIQAWVDPTSGAVSCLEPLRTQALRERHEARLVRFYGEWLGKNDLPAMSADELACESVTPDQRDWLGRFSTAWNYWTDLPVG